MSDPARDIDPSLGGAAVDQSVRAQEHDDIEVPTEDEVVETLRRQLEALEGAAAEKDRALEDSRRRAIEADRARQEADQRARQASHQARSATSEAQLDAVRNALASHDSQMTTLEATWANAQAEGDFVAAGKAQREMAVLGGRIAQLEAGRDALEQRVKEAPQQEQTQLTPSQQRDAYINRYTPKVQEWLRGPNGERFFGDSAFQKKVSGAASYAENVKGLDPHTQAYIDFIETEVGLRQGQEVNNTGRQNGGQANGYNQPNGRDVSRDAGRDAGRDADDGRRMTTAPAGGSTAGSIRSNADGSTSVYLTPTEKELARMQDMTDAEYARHKRDLLRENLIGPRARR